MVRLGKLSLLALSTATFDVASKAYALSAPTAIQIDGGPLGPLEFSGGMSGYFDFLSNTSDQTSTPGSFNGQESSTANLDAALLELQKSSGVLQYTIQVGPYNGTPVLGAPPSKATTIFFRKNSPSVGVSGNYTQGPVNFTVTFGDG